MLIEIKQFIMHILPYAPFLSAAVVTKGQLNVSSLISRLLESGVIAGIILYANVQVISNEIDNIDAKISDVKQTEAELKAFSRENRKINTQILVVLEGLKKDIQHHTKHSEK